MEFRLGVAIKLTVTRETSKPRPHPAQYHFDEVGGCGNAEAQHGIDLLLPRMRHHPQTSRPRNTTTPRIRLSLSVSRTRSGRTPSSALSARLPSTSTGCRMSVAPDSSSRTAQPPHSRPGRCRRIRPGETEAPYRRRRRAQQTCQGRTPQLTRRGRKHPPRCRAEAARQPEMPSANRPAYSAFERRPLPAVVSTSPIRLPTPLRSAFDFHVRRPSPPDTVQYGSVCLPIKVVIRSNAVNVCLADQTRRPPSRYAQCDPGPPYFIGCHIIYDVYKAPIAAAKIWLDCPSAQPVRSFTLDNGVGILARRPSSGPLRLADWFLNTRAIRPRSPHMAKTPIASPSPNPTHTRPAVPIRCDGPRATPAERQTTMSLAPSR